MSASKTLVEDDVIDHNESNVKESVAPHDEMPAIRSFLTSTVHNHDDGEEITAPAMAGGNDQALPRINVYENIPFAGGDGDYSVLSVLFGAHSIGGGIFGYLTMIDSNKVRAQCVECRQAVMDFPWMDAKSRIRGNVEAWRAAFPYARAVNVSHRNDIVDADFVHIRGDARVRLYSVKISGCHKVTDKAFVHLRGIHMLDMSGCYQATITDAAFVHLLGIHTLNMSECNQAAITDAAFVHLRGIHTLNMSWCNQATITGAAFVHLRGIHNLITNGCSAIVQASAAALRAESAT